MLALYQRREKAAVYQQRRKSLKHKHRTDEAEFLLRQHTCEHNACDRIKQLCGYAVDDVPLQRVGCACFKTPLRCDDWFVLLVKLYFQ